MLDRSRNIVIGLWRQVACFGMLVLLLSLGSCQSTVKHPAARKGVLDISGINLQGTGTIKLDGQWEFYWNQLYSPSDFSSRNIPMTGYIKVPVFWNSQQISRKKYPWSGYATYRLKITKDPTAGFLGIKIPDANSAYRLWINGSLVADIGKVGLTQAEEQPRLQPVIKIFSGNERELDIVLQVSNFFHHKAGVWQSISIGSEQAIFAKRDTSLLLGMCLAGAFFILGIYNMFIFILRKAEYSAAIFSLLSLCFSIRTFVIDERPILLFFPDLTTDLLHRIQYESIFAACALFTAFIYVLEQKEFPRKLLNIIIAASLAEFAIILATPVSFYTSLLIAFQLKVVLQAAVCLFVIARSIRKQNQWAWLLLVLLAMIAIGGINDVLYTNAIIHTGYRMHYFAFFILLTEAYVVASRITSTYFSFSKLTKELNVANLTLEDKVAVRTKELETEKKKADDLLLNILPAKTAYELREHGHSGVQVYKSATVMLIDMVGFTKVSEDVSAELLVAEIDECFKAFDTIIEDLQIEKIKTIGDAYLCAGGLPEPNDTHAFDIITAAIKINEFMDQRYREKTLHDEIAFQIRTGIHSGPVVAGVVGSKKFSYDIWGDTVNVAGYMEQQCQPGKINISETTFNLAEQHFTYAFTYDVNLPSGGTLKMYSLEQRVNSVMS